MRVETIGDCTLYLGDCMEVLPTLGKVDAVVTSPPYNINGGNHKPSGMFTDVPRNITRQWYKDDLPEDEYQAWMMTVLAESLKACSGVVWVNHKTRYDKVALHPVRFLDFPLWAEIIWDRGGSMTLNAKRFAPSHEVILGFGKPTYWDDSSNTLMTVWRLAPEQNADHPCSFPVAIPLRLIGASCKPNGTVLDPFMGSGTTGVACVKTGRRFIGIEIDPTYFDIACKRIEAATLQLRLPLEDA